MSFKFSGNFPHLYLNSKENKYSFIGNEDLKISLPSSLIDKFELYSPEEYEIEALQVFTPDVLIYLLDESWSYDVEFVGQEMIVFRFGEINSTSQFEDEFKKASRLASMFKSNLQGMSFSKISDVSYLLKDADNGLSFESSVAPRIFGVDKMSPKSALIFKALIFFFLFMWIYHDWSVSSQVSSLISF